MTTPVGTPPLQAVEVTLSRIVIEYNPQWDGLNWVVTVGDIQLRGSGNLGDGEPLISDASVALVGTDLPAGGQTALQQLYSFIEAELAAMFP